MSAGIGRQERARVNTPTRAGDWVPGAPIFFEINGQDGERVVEIEVLYQKRSGDWAVCGLAVRIYAPRTLVLVADAFKIKTNRDRVFVKSSPERHDGVWAAPYSHVLKPPKNGTIVGIFGVLVRAQGFHLEKSY